MTIPLSERVRDAAGYVREHIGPSPRTAVILGSGLGDFADQLGRSTVVQNDKIPHYPRATIEGHKGRIVVGEVNGNRVLALQGRVHFYECNDLDVVLFPIRVAHSIGIKKLIVTNAAGGINRSFAPGDLMLITDQINLTLQSYPFDPSTTARVLYDPELMETAIAAARREEIELKHGIYVGVKGPSYETAAEIEMIRRIGGDAVGMSTVFEVLLAHSLGMRVLGISCITNLATGISQKPLNHAEVTEAGNRVKGTFSRLLVSILQAL